MRSAPPHPSCVWKRGRCWAPCHRHRREPAFRGCSLRPCRGACVVCARHGGVSLLRGRFRVYLTHDVTLLTKPTAARSPLTVPEPLVTPAPARQLWNRCSWARGVREALLPESQPQTQLCPPRPAGGVGLQPAWMTRLPQSCPGNSCAPAAWEDPAASCSSGTAEVSFLKRRKVYCILS